MLGTPVAAMFASAGVTFLLSRRLLEQNRNGCRRACDHTRPGRAQGLLRSLGPKPFGSRAAHESARHLALMGPPEGCGGAWTTTPPTPKVEEDHHARRERLEQLVALTAVVQDSSHAVRGSVIGDPEAGEMSQENTWKGWRRFEIGGVEEASPPRSPADRSSPASPDVHGHLSPSSKARMASAEAKAASRRKPSLRQQDSAHSFKSAEERPSFGSSLAPKDRQGWSERHKNVYDNGKLNPNTRSYFDRHLNARTPDVSERLGVMLPMWRLDPAGTSEEERKAAVAALRLFSPQGPPQPSMRMQPRRAPWKRGRPERPWEQPPEPLPEDHELHRPGPGGGGSGGMDPLQRELSSSSLAEGQVVNPDTDPKFFQAASPGAYVEEAVGDWDDRHTVLWCNEQKVGDYTRLNPRQFRSYFDRWLEPEPGARSKTLRQDRPDGLGEEVYRIVPVWRLEPMPGGVMFPEPGELKVIPEPLVHMSGTGGDPKMMGISGSRSLERSASTPSRLPSSPAGMKRERRWNHRHDIIFKNEEVSRLDRSYFDRFREAECMIKLGDENAKQARGSVRVWSLEATEGPSATATKVTAQSEKRFTDDGHWNARHHLMFYNRIHPNARSYFERWREPPSEAAPQHLLKMADPSDSEEPAYMDPTAAKERRQREKLSDEDKLRVQWSLQDPAGPGDRDRLERSLRQPDSERDPKVARHKKRQREAWFSSHGMAF